MAEAEKIALAKARAAMYRFLGGLYIMEVDGVQLAALKKMTFPEVEGDGDADRDPHTETDRNRNAYPYTETD